MRVCVCGDDTALMKRDRDRDRDKDKDEREESEREKAGKSGRGEKRERGKRVVPARRGKKKNVTSLRMEACDILCPRGQRAVAVRNKLYKCCLHGMV